MSESQSAGALGVTSGTPDFSWGFMYGILLVLVGSTIDNVGITMQKLAHRAILHDEQEGKHTKRYCSNPKWAIGIVMYLVGNIVNAIGLGMCPQSLYSALGSISLVINVATAKWILKENVSKRVIIGTCVIIAGSICAVLFGDHAPESYTLDQLLTNLGKAVFITYFVIFCGCILLTISLIRFLHSHDRYHLHQDIHHPSEHYDYNDADMRPSIDVAGSDAVVDVKKRNYLSRFTDFCFEKLPWRSNSWRQMVLCIVYPLLAGMLGSITLLSAKIIAEIVKSASLGNPEFSKFSTYFFIFLIFALGAAQIHVLNLGLRKFDQIVVIPVFSVSLETFSILVGILYFEEYRNFSLTQALLFPVAIAITFIGVYITAKGQKEQDEQDENSKYIADAVPMPVDNQGIEVKE